MPGSGLLIYPVHREDDMSENQRSSGGGALFMGLVFIGFVAMFWWVIVAVLGVVLLAGAVWYVSRCLDARDAARLAIAPKLTSAEVSQTRATWGTLA
jgi:hypothetical protein